MTTISKIFILMIVGCSYDVFSQIRVAGNIEDARSHKSIAYVNVGIRGKNVGTASSKSGAFAIIIPPDYLNDTLTFSMVGYHELDLLIHGLNSDDKIMVQLIEKITVLNEFVISGDKFVQKKYGIKKRGLIHFTDGIFKENDSFEIGQLIKLGNTETQVTSVNLHINASRSDSASFRINFYRYDRDDNRPTRRIIEKNILQRHPVQEGWLKFDLTEYNILLKGNVLVSIEFIPENKDEVKQIYYEVKIGGSSKSFYRRSSLGQWNMPPHHYCLYVTALVDKNAPEETEDEETVPTVTLQPDLSKEPFSIFVRLPGNYLTDIGKRYPVVYHVDGNAFFDPILSSVDRLKKKNVIPVDPILVGIGYENAYVMDSLRNRDYTFPAALPEDSFHISGGGEGFYRFIETKLKPYVDKTYRTDTTNSTLMGHSLGGYFVLYTLLQDMRGNALFNNYVAASPSISYHDEYILKEFQNFKPANKNEKKIKLYLTTGGMESDEDPNKSFDRFGQILSRQDFIYFKLNVYKDLEHMGTAVPSFEDGMEFVLDGSQL